MELKHIVATSKGIEVPEYLTEAIVQTVLIRTPSGQFWNNLSPIQRDKWRELVTSLGEDPEAYLEHMRSMSPGVPKGV